MHPTDVKAQAIQIAATLGEHGDGPVREIRRTLQTLGLERTQALVEQAKTIDSEGGLMIPDGSRRRTLGGVFFVLVHHATTDDERKRIFLRKGKADPPQRPPLMRATPGTPAAPADVVGQAETNAPPTLTWPDRIPLLPELKHDYGEAKTVKATLIGRPGRVVIKGDTVITSMQTTKTPNAFPKGVPMPPTTPTLYTIYIGKKQWNNVAEAIKNPDDALIVEGFPAYDPELEGVAVFATNVTTKLLQAAKRQPQQANG